MRRAPLVLFIFFAKAASAIFMGTVEGYVVNTSASLVQGASVNAYVLNCVGGGCSGSTTTDAGGYYVIANLNIPAYGNVTVYASKDPASGVGYGQADVFFAAFVNVTVCQPPGQPALVAEPDTHYPNATLEWTSGVDPNGLTTHDEFQFNNQPIENVTSPKSVSGLSYAVHAWRARTCNDWCCSAWSEDSFSVYNNAPSAPVLVDEPNTLSPTVALEWTSGTDSDGDVTYDQFQLNAGPVENATSPKTVSGLASPSYNTWAVRTCDALGACSAWSSDSFIAGVATVVPTPPPAPTPRPEFVPFCPIGVPAPTVLPCLVPYPPTPTPVPTPPVVTPAITPTPVPCEEVLVKEKAERERCERELAIVSAPEVVPPGPCFYEVPLAGRVSCDVAWLFLSAVLAAGLLVALKRRLAKSAFRTVRVVHRSWPHVTISNKFLAVLLVGYATAFALGVASIEVSPTGAVVAWYGKLVLEVFLAACLIVFAWLAGDKVFKKKKH